MSSAATRETSWYWWLETLACIALFAMLALTVSDVLGRYVIARPVPGISELVQYTMVIVVFAGLPVLTLRRQHLSVSIIDGALRGRARVAQRFAVAAISAAVLAVQAWVLFRYALGMLEARDVIGALRLPVYPAAIFMAVLSALAAVASLLAAREAPAAAGVG